MLDICSFDFAAYKYPCPEQTLRWQLPRCWISEVFLAAKPYMPFICLLKSTNYSLLLCQCLSSAHHKTGEGCDTTSWIHETADGYNYTISFFDTFCRYYLNLESAHLADFTDPNVMNKLPGKVNLAKKTLASAGFGNLSLWLGESGTCLGTTEGINYCQRFVSGFLWVYKCVSVSHTLADTLTSFSYSFDHRLAWPFSLCNADRWMDKLGMAASMGVEAVIRQSLYEGVDALLDEQLDPLPVNFFYIKRYTAYHLH